MADKPYKPLQILLEPELHAKFKTLCSIQGVKMTEITKEMIEGWINSQYDDIPWLKETLQKQVDMNKK